MKGQNDSLVLKITDWYLDRHNPVNGYVYFNNENQDIKSTTDEIRTISQKLHDLCEEAYKEKGVDFKIIYKEDGYDLRYRCHTILGAEKDVFALRFIPREIIEADNLKLPELVSSVLKSPALSRGGLVLISGETGQGKTTTCTSMIKRRMEDFGSFALTIEDPPEYYLDGVYGAKNGRCIQTEVRSGQFATALKGAMRSYPAQSGSILYVGETRDSETASEIIKAVNNGHIVFTTIHGMNIISTIDRFISMCAGQNLSTDEVKQTIAMSLRLVVHQRLEKHYSAYDNTLTVNVNCKSLFSDGPTSTVANKIISSNIRGLAEDVTLQDTKIINNGVRSVIGEWENKAR